MNYAWDDPCAWRGVHVSGTSVRRTSNSKRTCDSGASLGKALNRLLSGEWRALFVKCVGECICVDGVRVSDGGVRNAFVQLEYYSRGSCSSKNDYDWALKVLKAGEIGERVLREQKVYASGNIVE